MEHIAEDNTTDCHNALPTEQSNFPPNSYLKAFCWDGNDPVSMYHHFRRPTRLQAIEKQHFQIRKQSRLRYAEHISDLNDEEDDDEEVSPISSGDEETLCDYHEESPVEKPGTLPAQGTTSSVAGYDMSSIWDDEWDDILSEDEAKQHKDTAPCEEFEHHKTRDDDFVYPKAAIKTCLIGQGWDHSSNVDDTLPKDFTSTSINEQLRESESVSTGDLLNRLDECRESESALREQLEETQRSDEKRRRKVLELEQRERSYLDTIHDQESRIEQLEVENTALEKKLKRKKQKILDLKKRLIQEMTPARPKKEVLDVSMSTQPSTKRVVPKNKLGSQIIAPAKRELFRLGNWVEAAIAEAFQTREASTQLRSISLF